MNGIMAHPVAVTIGARVLGGLAALNINPLAKVVPLTKPATRAHIVNFAQGITPATAAFKDLTVLIALRKRLDTSAKRVEMITTATLDTYVTRAHSGSGEDHASKVYRLRATAICQRSTPEQLSRVQSMS